MSLATLRSSTVQTINDNIITATLRPEFFGPTSYANGSIVALPVSTVDGYSYSRLECQYLAWWADTGSDGAESQIRMPLFAYKIDQATGLVTIVVDRLQPGGPPTTSNDGSLAVVTIAMRIFENPALDASGGTHNPPADLGSLEFDNTYDVWFTLAGKPPAATTIAIGKFPHLVRFSGNFLLAQGGSLIAPSADQVWPLSRIAGGTAPPVQVGTVSFLTAGGVVASFGSGTGGPFVDFNKADVMTVTTSAVQDATLSDTFFTLTGKA